MSLSKDAVNSFIDHFPALEKKLKDALTAKEYDTFAKCLTDIGNILTEISADNLTAECQKQIDQLNSMGSEIDHEKIEEDMAAFLMSVSTLSLDLQMEEQMEDMEDKEKAAPEPLANTVESATMGKNKILAVDDAAIFLNTLKMHLQGTEYELTCVNSGKTALNFLVNNHPSLFILDINMPVMDGYELAREIRKRGQKAPIVFLTSSADRNSVIKAAKAGGVGFILKPVTKTLLLERIKKYIANG